MGIRFGLALLLGVGFLSLTVLPTYAEDILQSIIIEGDHADKDILQPTAIESDHYANKDTEVYLDMPDGWAYTDADLSDITLAYGKLYGSGYEWSEVSLGNNVAIHPREFVFSDYQISAYGDVSGYHYRFLDNSNYKTVDQLSEGSFFVNFMFKNFLTKPILGAGPSLAQNESLPVITITKSPSQYAIDSGLNEAGLKKRFYSIMDAWGKEFAIDSVEEKTWGWEVHDYLGTARYSFDDHKIDERHYFFRDGSYYVVKIFTPAFYEYDKAAVDLVLGTLEIKGAMVQGKEANGNAVVQDEKAGVGTAQGGKDGGGCLIATATYGSELAPQVQQLRELRDGSLLQTESGAAFMDMFNGFYYSFSPAIADYERQNPAFRDAVRIAITPMISSLSVLNFVGMDSEADVLGYGISLILLNIGMYFAAPVVVAMKIRRRRCGRMHL